MAGSCELAWARASRRANLAMSCLRSAADAAVMGGKPSRQTPPDKRLGSNKPRTVKPTPRPPRKGK